MNLSISNYYSDNQSNIFIINILINQLYFMEILIFFFFLFIFGLLTFSTKSSNII